MNLDDKIKKLRTIYLSPQDQREISDLEKRIAREITIVQFSEDATVKLLIEDAGNKIQDINTLLTTDRALTDTERQALFHERDVHEFWYERLSGKKAQQVLNYIESTVNQKFTAQA